MILRNQKVVFLFSTVIFCLAAGAIYFYYQREALTREGLLALLARRGVREVSFKAVRFESGEWVVDSLQLGRAFTAKQFRCKLKTREFDWRGGVFLGAELPKGSGRFLDDSTGSGGLTAQGMWRLGVVILPCTLDIQGRRSGEWVLLDTVTLNIGASRVALDSAALSLSGDFRAQGWGEFQLEELNSQLSIRGRLRARGMVKGRDRLTSGTVDLSGGLLSTKDFSVSRLKGGVSWEQNHLQFQLNLTLDRVENTGAIVLPSGLKGKANLSGTAKDWRGMVEKFKSLAPPRRF